ncbi:MAG TPA: hypothetical protein VM163_09265 [bacterium]|nr:hypothetical protein [bacterium]
MTRQSRDRVRQPLAFFLSSAYRAIRLAWLQFALSAVALAVFAFTLTYLFAISNADAHLAEKIAAADRLTVYAPGSLEPARVEALISWAKSQNVVKRVKQRPFNSYFSDLCSSLGLDADTLGQPPPGVAPQVLDVHIAPETASRDSLGQFTSDLRSRPDVLAVYFPRDPLLGLSELLGRFKRLVLALFCACCLLVVVRFVTGGRALIEANKDAVGIMKLAGAGLKTVAGPFVCYGVLQWVIGMVLAFAAWRLIFPIKLAYSGGITAELTGLFAPQLAAIDVILIGLAAAAISLLPLLIIVRSRFRDFDPFVEHASARAQTNSIQP